MVFFSVNNKLWTIRKYSDLNNLSSLTIRTYFTNTVEPSLNVNLISRLNMTAI